MSILSWLFKGIGNNKTTFAGIAGFFGGLGLIINSIANGNGMSSEGVTLAFISVQQLFMRWVKNPNEVLFFQRTFLAAIGGVFTSIYMMSQGNVSEGVVLFMASIETIFQRQAVSKKPSL